MNSCLKEIYSIKWIHTMVTSCWLKKKPPDSVYYDGSSMTMYRGPHVEGDPTYTF